MLIILMENERQNCDFFSYIAIYETFNCFLNLLLSGETYLLEKRLLRFATNDRFRCGGYPLVRISLRAKRQSRAVIHIYMKHCFQYFFFD